MARLRSALFVVSVVAVFLSAPAATAQAQPENSRDKGITGEKVDTRLVPEERVPALPLQPAPCDGAKYTTNAFNNNIFMVGPIVGIAWTRGATLTITRVEIFTGESTAPIALAIWSDAGGSPSKPLADLGDTGYFNLPSTVNSWQWANLGPSVT